VKISPMHEGGPMAAHDETLPMAEYAVRAAISRMKVGHIRAPPSRVSSCQRRKW
jgi:hypothetical protein